MRQFLAVHSGSFRLKVAQAAADIPDGRAATDGVNCTN